MATSSRPQADHQDLPAHGAVGQALWMKHGALDYRECVGDNLKVKFGMPPSRRRWSSRRPGETVFYLVRRLQVARAPRSRQRPCDQGNDGRRPAAGNAFRRQAHGLRRIQSARQRPQAQLTTEQLTTNNNNEQLRTVRSWQLLVVRCELLLSPSSPAPPEPTRPGELLRRLTAAQPAERDHQPNHTERHERHRSMTIQSERRVESGGPNTNRNACALYNLASNRKTSAKNRTSTTIRHRSQPQVASPRFSRPIRFAEPIARSTPWSQASSPEERAHRIRTLPSRLVTPANGDRSRGSIPEGSERPRSKAGP